MKHTANKVKNLDITYFKKTTMDNRMNIILLTLVFTSTTTGDYCQGIYFNEKYYNIELLKEGLNRVHQMVYNHNDDTLYFTFEQIAKYPTRMLGFLKLENKEVGIIDSIRNATGLAIDRNNNRVYVGGSDGLFFLNVNKNVQQLPVADDIRHLFFNTVIYFINSKGEVFVFDHGDITPINELKGAVAEQLIVDDANNILFLSNNKLFRTKLGEIHGAIHSYEKYFVDTISTDINFRPYVCAKSGVFIFNKYKYALDKVANMNGIRALTFIGKDDPIYVVIDNLVRLKFNPIPCFGD